MRGTLVLTLALLLVPLASAQSPADPAALVAAACAAAGTVDPGVRDQLPVCPREEPAGPAAPGEEEDDAQKAPAAPASPDPRQDPAGAAQDLAGQAATAAQESVEDPQGAPARLVGLLASVRQFVEDLLGVAGLARDALGERAASAWSAFEASYVETHDAFAGAFAATGDAVGEAVAAAGDAARAVGDAFGGGIAALRNLFGREPEERDAVEKTRVGVDRATEDATTLVDRLTSKLPA